MRQEVILFIVLLSCIVAFLAGAIFMMMRSYRIMVRERYDFLTKFPYEGFEARSYYGRWAIVLILLYVLSLGISFFFAMFARRSLPGQSARDMVVAIVGGLLSLSTCGYLFVDAGNIWELPHHLDGTDIIDNEDAILTWKNALKSSALSWGAGVRLDLQMLVIRVDLGIKGYDPAVQAWRGPDRWFKQDGYTLHFGVGYPF